MYNAHKNVECYLFKNIETTMTANFSTTFLHPLLLFFKTIANFKRITKKIVKFAFSVYVCSNASCDRTLMPAESANVLPFAVRAVPTVE